MKKWLLVAMAMFIAGGAALADVAVGRGGANDQISASLDVTVSWSAYKWIVLYIPTNDMAINLGDIDASLYDPVNDQWTPISDGKNHSVYVITNNSQGFVLDVTAANSANADQQADLSRFQIKYGNNSWTSLDNKATLLSESGPGRYSIADIQYQYVPSWADAPGSYEVIVTYTATTQ